MQTSLSMKRQLLPYIVSVLLSAACSDRLSEMQEVPDIPGTVSAEEAYVPGVFRVKVSETSPALDTKVFTRSGGSGSEEFDRAAVRAGAVSISRVFSDGGRFMESTYTPNAEWINLFFESVDKVKNGSTTVDDFIAEIAPQMQASLDEAWDSVS